MHVLDDIPPNVLTESSNSFSDALLAHQNIPVTMKYVSHLGTIASYTRDLEVKKIALKAHPSAPKNPDNPYSGHPTDIGAKVSRNEGGEALKMDVGTDYYFEESPFYASPISGTKTRDAPKDGKNIDITLYSTLNVRLSHEFDPATKTLTIASQLRHPPQAGKRQADSEPENTAKRSRES
jgi:hypothetical protein